MLLKCTIPGSRATARSSLLDDFLDLKLRMEGGKTVFHA